MLQNQDSFRQLFDKNLDLSLKDLRPILKHHPASIKALVKVVRHQKKASRTRAFQVEQGTPVPPLLIVSTTDACNLRCAGCYAQALRPSPKSGLSDEKVRDILAEAEKLGVSAILLAGGEPLLQKNWLDALATHPYLAGLVFTNGTLLHGQWLDWFNLNRQILPVISLEGNAQTTDQRRGSGVFRLIMQNLQHMQKRNLPYGLSITLSRQNIEQVRSDELIAEFTGIGCRLFVFVEYVPVEAGTDELALTLPEKQAFIEWLSIAQRKHSALFLIFPGDETPYGGCLASARGFVHISASGDLEPCPFAPYSDRNLNQVSLEAALRSDFLKAIRDHHELLQEGRGGCALWHHQDWVASVLSAGKTAEASGKAADNDLI